MNTTLTQFGSASVRHAQYRREPKLHPQNFAEEKDPAAVKLGRKGGKEIAKRVSLSKMPSIVFWTQCNLVTF